MGHFKFFKKFAEIFASQGAAPVSTTPAANNGNTIRLLTPESELPKKNIDLYVVLTTRENGFMDLWV